MLRGLAALAAVCALAGVAGAEPVQIGNETWQHVAEPGADRFERADGTAVELAAAQLSCAEQLRVAPADRYDWLPRTYWPQLDTGAGFLVLCLERMEGPVAVTVKPGKGKAIGADLAPVLGWLADQIRPPTPTVVGPIRTSWPVVMTQESSIAFLTGKTEHDSVVLSLSPADGSCAYEHMIVALKLGTISSSTGFAPGYYGSVVTTDKGLVLGCLDTRDGYVTVTFTPGDKVALLTDVLAEVRQAAYERLGAPITNETDPMVLPRTQQRVSAKTGAGAWKAVDGERYKLAGGDVLVSTFALGVGHTMFAIGVGEGPCAPGTAEAPADVAANLFPAQLGKVWVDTDPYKLRWKAWACVAQGGASATISVLAPIAHEQPPGSLESSGIRAMVAAVARSYGVDVPLDGGGGDTPGGGGGDRSYGSPKVVVQASGYVGVLSFADAMGDRRSGGLVGLTMRVAQTKGAGVAFAFDTEVGYGAGELVGEIRTGVGLAFGRRTVLDVVAGGAVGSMGPSAALDLYGEASVTTPFGRRGLLWFGAMRTLGMDGADQLRLEMRLGMTRRDDTGYTFGARFTGFGDTLADDDVTTIENGSAFLITVGGGAMAWN